MTSDVELLLSRSNKMFEEVIPLRSLQQELADNFYPERSDFTSTRSIGSEFASHLTTSFPVKVRRDLANIFSTMLRPQEKLWARMTVRNYDDLSDESKDWLDNSSKALRNAMYDNVSGFARATSQADDDVATFGNACISCEVDWSTQSFLFRTWHLKDVVWSEDEKGRVGRVDRKWFPTVSELNRIFRGRVHQKVKDAMAKDPHKKIEVRHMFIPVNECSHKKPPAGAKYWSIFYDVENKFVIEEVPYKHGYYCIPRWKTIPGSQYAFSPAAMSSLPDARTAQAMMLILLEAGEKAVDPPMIAIEDVLRSDANLFSGGITVISPDHDERMGRPLYPVLDSTSTNIPIGFELLQSMKVAIEEAFYLNKVGLPPLAGGMSPFEVGQRVSEYVRNALPLFEPLEPEYNGALCSLAFDVGFAAGLFGRKEDIPEELLGRNIDFKFENPLRDAADRAKGNLLLESVSVVNQMAAYDPSVSHIIDAHAAVRDTLEGIGSPRKWFRNLEEVAERVESEQSAMAMQNVMGAVQQGAETAKTVGEASNALQGIQGVA